jgi:hypothetical protein
MKEGTLRRVVTTPLTASPPSSMNCGDPPSARGVAFAQARGDNDNNRYKRTQRQVELAGDEHEGRPGGEYHQRRGAGQERQEERRAEEERRDQRRAEQQHREHHEDRAYGEQRPDHPLAATRGRHGPLGRGAHAFPRRRRA